MGELLSGFWRESVKTLKILSRNKMGMTRARRWSSS